MVIERAMSAEMSEPLGYEPGRGKPVGQGNQCTGISPKTVIIDERPVRIDVPRDREGGFEGRRKLSVSCQQCGSRRTNFLLGARSCAAMPGRR